MLKSDKMKLANLIPNLGSAAKKIRSLVLSGSIIFRLWFMIVTFTLVSAGFIVGVSLKSKQSQRQTAELKSLHIVAFAHFNQISEGLNNTSLLVRQSQASVSAERTAQRLELWKQKIEPAVRGLYKVAGQIDKGKFTPIVDSAMHLLSSQKLLENEIEKQIASLEVVSVSEFAPAGDNTSTNSLLNKVQDNFDKKTKIYEMINEQLVINILQIHTLLSPMRLKIDSSIDKSMVDIENSISRLKTITVIWGIILIVVSLTVGLVTIAKIESTLQAPIDALKKLSKGEISQTLDTSGDETDRIVILTNKIIRNFRRIAAFARAIGEGNNDAEFSPLGPEDEIGNTLQAMRSRLVSVAEQDKWQNWSVQGQALFAQVLRNNQNDFRQMTKELVKNLANYLEASQCALYVLNDEDLRNPFLELEATFAYGKNKHLVAKILPRQGFIGQVYSENKKLYLTEVPDDFHRIESALGSAHPSNALLVPLTAGDVCVGVIEISSFKKLNDQQIDFAEVLARSIGTTISSVKINEKTRILLEETRMQTEELKAQEEELRQNMEEMQATQEEMARKNIEFEARVVAIENSGIASAEYDTEGNLLAANAAFLRLMGLKQNQIYDAQYDSFLPTEQSGSAESIKAWSQLLRGRRMAGEFKKRTNDGKILTVSGSLSVILDYHGDPFKVIEMFFDVTALVNANAKLSALEKKLEMAKESAEQLAEEINIIRANNKSLLDLAQFNAQFIDQNVPSIQLKNNGEIIAINQPFADIISKQPNELVGRSFGKILAGSSQLLFTALLSGTKWNNNPIGLKTDNGTINLKAFSEVVASSEGVEKIVITFIADNNLIARADTN